MDDDFYDEERWRGDLVFMISDHDLDNMSGIDPEIMAEHMATVMGSLVRMIKKRDQNAPAPLDIKERAELAALRKVAKLQEEVVAKERLKVSDLEIRLADVQRQRDVEESDLGGGILSVVDKSLQRSGLTVDQAIKAIACMQNDGVLFRSMSGLTPS